MSSTTINIVLPTARTDGTPLALTEIASITGTKAVGSNPATILVTLTGPFATPTLTITDPSPDLGQTDNYSVTVTDVEGNVSAAGNASVAVPPSALAPPNAPTVTATFNP
jgi:hypothetical protein